MDKSDKNIEKIIEYFKSGIKTDELKTGFEVEHFICTNNGGAADYDTVCHIAREIQKSFDNSRDILYNGKYIGFLNGEYSVSFEPSCQLEISIFPQSDIFKLFDIYSTFFKKLKDVSAQMGLSVHTVGYHPYKKAAELEFIPKERYRFMDKYFEKTGKLGKNMMRATCSVQVAIDYTSEYDFIKKYRLASVLSPLFSLICDNSPVFEGEKNTMYAVRNYIWNSVDNKRCGVIKGIFDDDFGFNKYARLVYNTAVIVDERNGETVYAEDMPYSEIYIDSEITNTQIEHLLSMFFFDVRLKKYIEIRMADSMPPQYIFAYVALINSIFYGGNGECVDALYKKYCKVKESDILNAKTSIIKDGYSASVYGNTVFDILEDIFDTVDIYADKLTAKAYRPLADKIKSYKKE